MFEPVIATRVVSTPEAIAVMTTPDAAIVLRTSPDEALIVGARPGQIGIDDPDAIVTSDTGWHGAWLDADQTHQLMRHSADWQLPQIRPVLAQGMVLQLPVKLWLEDDRTLLLAPHVVAADLTERIGAIT